jgi:hypothetical protein
MSNLEIEKAAMGPHRWTELCGPFENQDLNDHGVILRPRSTRIINALFPTVVDNDFDFFIVPGGRYLVRSSQECVSVLDLGFASSSDCKLIASVELPLDGVNTDIQVQTTSDGMGLTETLRMRSHK